VDISRIEDKVDCFMTQIIARAVIFGNKEMDSFLRLLKSFLFKVGLKDSIMTSDIKELSALVHDDFWPVIFVDHTDGYRDGFIQFEAIYKNMGLELFPYFLMTPADKKHFKLFGSSAGLSAVLEKPLQPKEAEQTIQSFLPNRADNWVESALLASKFILKKDYPAAKAILAKLATQPKYSFTATIASIRCDIASGSHSLAEQKLKFLHARDPKNIRVMSEYAELLRKNCRFNDTLEMYDKIHKLHPQMNIKVWDEILLYLELDMIDEAAVLLDGLQSDLTFRDFAIDGLLRIMCQLGLQQHAGTALKVHPGLLKQYSGQLNESHKTQKPI
jgi:tetratricopeptide (TPR) repeat protein